MSVRIMSMVFDRYPVGGGEYVLALALADHSHEDGSRIFPSVESLAQKSRQSVRTIQRQLIAMQESGWLVLVREGGKGPKNTNEYRINPAWVDGADFSSIKPKGDILSPLADEKRVTSETLRVTKTAIKGDIAVSPESSVTISKATINAREVLAQLGIDPDVAADWIELRKRLKAPITKTVLKEFQLEAEKAGYTLEQVLRTCCKNGWRGFEARWVKDRGGGAVQTSGPPWWSSDSLILAKGAELGLSARPGESMGEFKGRINAKIAESAGNSGARSAAG